MGKLGRYPLPALQTISLTYFAKLVTLGGVEHSNVQALRKADLSKEVALGAAVLLELLSNTAAYGRRLKTTFRTSWRAQTNQRQLRTVKSYGLKWMSQNHHRPFLSCA
jgi:hypothetical protein